MNNFQTKISLASLLIFLILGACTEENQPTVHNNSVPTCTFVSPLHGETFFHNDTIKVSVDANDLDGSIVSVEFYIDDLLIFQDDQSPFEHMWIPGKEELGSHQIKAIAIDNNHAARQSEIGITVEYKYVQPLDINDGISISSLLSEGVNKNLIADMMSYISLNNYDFFRSIIILKNGNLIFEENFGNIQISSLHHIQSATKSVTSILIGIAMEEGFINNVDEPIFNFFPEYASYNDSLKSQITLGHVLSMTPGLDWNEVSTPTTAPHNDNMFAHSVNYIAYVLAKPVINTPGSSWYYNSGCSVLLGGVLRNTTLMEASQYARIKLFNPLGITRIYWSSMFNTNDLTSTHGGLSLTARGMAKIGQLYLEKGRAGNIQIVSEEWVNESTQPHAIVGGTIRYGYQWWLRNLYGYEAFYADGYGGQQIVVIPEKNCVIVTAAEYDHLLDQPNNAHGIQRGIIWNIIENYLVRAL